MTMANDCLLKEKKTFEEGFEFFQLSLSSVGNERFEKLQINPKTRIHF